MARHILELLAPQPIPREQFLRRRHILRTVPCSFLAAACVDRMPAGSSLLCSAPGGVACTFDNMVPSRVPTTIVASASVTGKDLVRQVIRSVYQRLALYKKLTHLPARIFFQVAQEVRQRRPHIIEAPPPLLAIKDIPRAAASSRTSTPLAKGVGNVVRQRARKSLFGGASTRSRRELVAQANGTVRVIAEEWDLVGKRPEDERGADILAGLLMFLESHTAASGEVLASKLSEVISELNTIHLSDTNMAVIPRLQHAQSLYRGDG